METKIVHVCGLERRESRFHEWEDQGAEICILEGRDCRDADDVLKLEQASDE